MEDNGATNCTSAHSKSFLRETVRNILQISFLRQFPRFPLLSELSGNRRFLRKIRIAIVALPKTRLSGSGPDAMGLVGFPPCLGVVSKKNCTDR